MTTLVQNGNLVSFDDRSRLRAAYINGKIAVRCPYCHNKNLEYDARKVWDGDGNEKRFIRCVHCDRIFQVKKKVKANG